MLVSDFWFPNDICPPISKAFDYAITLADRGQTFNMNKATAINLTLPKDATQAIPIGSRIRSFQGGAGQLTFVAESGATVVSETGNLTTQAQYAMVTAEKIAANTWLLFGAGLTVTSNVIARTVSHNDVLSTASKTASWSFTVPANKLSTNKSIVIEMWGDYLQNNGTSKTITLEMVFGTTVMWADISSAITANATRHPWSIRVILNADGTASSEQLSGKVSCSAVAATTNLGDIGILLTAVTGWEASILGPASEDSTVDKTFTFNVTHSASSASQSWRLFGGIAYMLGEGQKGDSTPGPQGIAGTGTGTFPTSANSPQSGSYTLQSSDIGQRLAASTSSTQTITVPNQSTLAMSDGQMFGIHVTSTGVVTVAGGLGVTLHPATIVSSRQDGVIWVVRMDTSNNFLVLGDFL